MLFINLFLNYSEKDAWEYFYAQKIYNCSSLTQRSPYVTILILTESFFDQLELLKNDVNSVHEAM